ncbi:adenylosuccinate lyase [Streptococcus pneumoniae]|nr:adenylosuccinate lyase [Streptococcus pneumoniae]
MFSQLHMREEQVLLAQDYALETARAEGLEQGLERGKVEGRAERKLFAFLDIVRQGLLTSEVASQQLGMSVYGAYFCVEKKSHMTYNEKRQNNSLKRIIWNNYILSQNY